MTTTDTIFAKDQDVGINMDIRYMLSSNPGTFLNKKMVSKLNKYNFFLFLENLFEINEKNAQLTLKNHILDYEKLEYNLIVKVI